MGPQERRLLSELAVYLVRNCSRSLQELPPGAILDIATRRRWFVRAYHEWHLTPRVDLAGRSPYEVIAAERAAATDVAPRMAIEMYTDLPSFDPGIALTPNNHAATSSLGDSEASRDDRDDSAGWQHLADRLFGSWLDDDLDRL